MNRDAGSYQLSHTWNQVISRSRALSSCKQSIRDQDVTDSGRQRGTATDQMNKRDTLDQEDTDVRESGCRILPT